MRCLMVSSTSEVTHRAGTTPAAVAAYALALGDDALIASHRLGELIGRAPQIEEDIALANIGLDLLGQARTLLTYAGSLGAADAANPADEDQLAYFREGRDFRNVHLVERPNGDFAVTIVRLLMFSCYQCELYTGLCGSTDPTISAIAAKAVKEVTYHRDHASLWVTRLGDGTEESHARTQAALDAEWPFLAELFEPVEDTLVDVGVAVDPVGLREPVLERIWAVLAAGTLAEPEVDDAVTGGRSGVHSEAFGYLLAEMQHLARSHLGARW